MAKTMEELEAGLTAVMAENAALKARLDAAKAPSTVQTPAPAPVNNAPAPVSQNSFWGYVAAAVTAAAVTAAAVSYFDDDGPTV